MQELLYPLRFQPLYEPRPWAGAALHTYLCAGEVRPPVPAGTGISWEIAGQPELSCTVVNGPLAGTTLSELTERFPKHLVGHRHPPRNPFPLCVRLIDVGGDQPLTVHPTTPLKLGDQTVRPNNKFWFSLADSEGACISAGIKLGGTRQQVLHNLDSPDLRQLLQTFPSQSGDSFFLPSGRVHGLTAGCLVWELAEHPGAPLRISTWGTPDELTAMEQDAAIDAVYFQDRQLSRISREAGSITHTRRIPLVRLCPRFEVDEIRLRDHTFDRTTGAACHLLGVVAGSVAIQCAAGTERFEQGSVACLPAALGDYQVYAETETASILRAVPRMA